MPMSTRELYLVLRARDEASRTLRGLSRELLSTGAAASAAASRAQAGIERETAARARREAQMARDLAARYRAIAANTREQATLARMNGATNDSIKYMRQRAIQYDRLARVQESVARGHDRVARAALAEAQGMDQAARAAQEVELRHRHMMSIVEQGGLAIATAGVGMVAAAAVTGAAIGDLVKTSVEYERQVRHTATQVDGFKGNLQELGDMGRRLARDFAVPFEEIQPALFDIFSSLEVTAPQAELLLRSFAKAAVAGQVDIQDASRATIGILNAFQLPLTDVNKILDMQFQLVQEGIGNYEEWAQKIGLVSPSAARAGQSVEMMLAALATATRMGMSAARATTSVARAFDAMSHPKVIDKLKGLGVNALDASGKMRPLNQVLHDFRDALMKLPEPKRVETMLEIFKGAGGTIEARRFLQTMLLVPGALEQFDNILGELKNSAGSLDQAYGLMADSAAAKTEQLKNKWMLLKEGLGTALTPAFITFVDLVSKVVDKFNGLSPSTRKVIADALALAVALGGISGTVMVIVGALAAFIAAVSAAGSVLAIVAGVVVGIVGGIGALGAAFYLAYQNSEPFRVMISQMQEEFKTFWDIISWAASNIKTIFETQLGPSFAKISAYVNEWVLPAFNAFRQAVSQHLLDSIKSLIEVGLTRLQGVLGTLRDAIDSWVMPAIKGLTETWLEHRDQLMPIIHLLIEVLEWFGKIGLYVGGTLLVILGGAFLAVLTGVISIIQLAISTIGACVRAWHGLVDIVRLVIMWFEAMWNGVKNNVGSMMNYLQGIPGKIQGFFSGMGTLLINAGRAIIDGLILGIEQKFGALMSKLSEVTNFISEHKGPLDRDRRLLIPAGRAIMAGLMTGIKAGLPGVKDTLDGITTSIEGTGSGPGPDDGPTFRKPDIPPPGPGSGGVTKIYNITQNITTQEINPIRQAAALGWEIQTVS